MTGPRGLPQPYADVLTSEDTAVSPVDSPRPNEVLWWHICPAQEGWVAAGLGLHTITGSIKEGDLTIRASILCADCGKHGFITNSVWADA